MRLRLGQRRLKEEEKKTNEIGLTDHLTWTIQHHEARSLTNENEMKYLQTQSNGNCCNVNTCVFWCDLHLENDLNLMHHAVFWHSVDGYEEDIVIIQSNS